MAGSPARRKRCVADRKLTRLVVMGAGTIGLRHMEMALANVRCKLAGVVDLNHAAKDLPDVPARKTLDELLEVTEAEAVIVATPTELHEEHAAACARRRLPALVEKPVTSTLESAARMAEAARKAGTPVLVGHVRRHSPAIQVARSAIGAGELGEVVAATAIWNLYKPEEYFGKAWRSGTGGGPLLINAIHDIDTLRHLIGEVEEVRSMVAPSRRGMDCEDTAAVVMRFACGALGTLSVSDIAASPWGWELNMADKTSFDHGITGQDCYYICGTKASLAVPSLRLWHHEGRPDWQANMESRLLKAGGGSSLALQLDHFLDVVEGKAEPLCGIEDAARTLEVVQAVREGGA